MRLADTPRHFAYNSYSLVLVIIHAYVVHYFRIEIYFRLLEDVQNIRWCNPNLANLIHYLSATFVIRNYKIHLRVMAYLANFFITLLYGPVWKMDLCNPNRLRLIFFLNFYNGLIFIVIYWKLKLFRKGLLCTRTLELGSRDIFLWFKFGLLNCSVKLLLQTNFHRQMLKTKPFYHINILLISEGFQEGGPYSIRIFRSNLECRNTITQRFC